MPKSTPLLTKTLKFVKVNNPELGSFILKLASIFARLINGARLEAGLTIGPIFDNRR